MTWNTALGRASRVLPAWRARLTSTPTGQSRASRRRIRVNEASQLHAARRSGSSMERLRRTSTHTTSPHLYQTNKRSQPSVTRVGRFLSVQNSTHTSCNFVIFQRRNTVWKCVTHSTLVANGIPIHFLKFRHGIVITSCRICVNKINFNEKICWF